MYEGLKHYFTLCSTFRKSNILNRNLILSEAMPALRARTDSPRLKQAISKFISENTHVAQAGT